MLLTQICVMVAILFLLAPGGFSWFSEERRPSRSFTFGVAIVKPTSALPLSVSKMSSYALRVALGGSVTSLQLAHGDY